VASWIGEGSDIYLRNASEFRIFGRHCPETDMRRPFALALLAYLVPTFLLGYVWHLRLFADLYHDLGIYRPDVIIPFGFLSMLLQGSVFAGVFLRIVDRPSSLSSAMQFAAAAALLSWTFTTLAVAAKHPMTSVSRFVLVETCFTVVQFALVGPLLALSGRATRSAATVAS
jgi:hypothetical protein